MIFLTKCAILVEQNEGSDRHCLPGARLLFKNARFKQGFGGDFTEFVGEMDLVLSPAIYWAVEHGTSVFKELRKKVYLIRNRGK